MKLLVIEIIQAFLNKSILKTLKVKNKKTGQNTYDFYMRISTDRDILREDIVTLFLNQHLTLKNRLN